MPHPLAVTRPVSNFKDQPAEWKQGSLHTDTQLTSPYKVKGDQHLSTDTLQKGGKLSNDNLARVWQRVCE